MFSLCDAIRSSWLAIPDFRRHLIASVTTKCRRSQCVTRSGLRGSRSRTSVDTSSRPLLRSADALSVRRDPVFVAGEPAALRGQTALRSPMRDDSFEEILLNRYVRKADFRRHVIAAV